ncbi:N-acylphosphatidylethanolamine synthase-like [Humulus lupulus]|uniref:N-acylphosphatidylethanolamine synthase-like n=1 Tax=Humulus lupulus TaxID=3486 RepID=UPI002B412625|nr:N-acylphosphatidylethanolamine synthase-like [Humulus lupulus]
MDSTLLMEDQDHDHDHDHGRKMEWAGRETHLGGIPRKIAFMAVGGLAKLLASSLNSTSVHNPETLLRLVRSRPPGVPLITISNHVSVLDDPLLWGFRGFPSMDSKLGRWVLAAKDICFTNNLSSYFFRIGKCIPITRGGGIYQEHMNEALEKLRTGAWLHIFPEGIVSPEDAPIRRLKWGTASLIARATITPIVLPIVHRGFEQVMPQSAPYGRRPLLPLSNKNISISVGEPIEFDLPKMRQMATSLSHSISLNPLLGWPSTPDGLDEAAQRYLYSTISEKIQTAMESLRVLGNDEKKLTEWLRYKDDL